MNQPTIISLGEVLWDLFPEGERFGGAPANFACHAAISGAKVSLVSAVGNDRHGRKALDILRRYGIDVTLMQTVSDAATGTVGVALNSAGKPTFTIHENSAWDRITWTDEIEARVRAADVVYFGTLGQRSSVSRNTIRRSIQAARDAGVPSIVDINLRSPFFDNDLIRESIELASILKLSDDELAEVCCACGVAASDHSEAMMRGLLKIGNLDMVVMTCGSEGAVMVTPDGTVSQDGIPTNVIDTVGAGDSFTAAFLIGELRGEPHKKNLCTACEMAAATCGHSGGVPSPESIESLPQQ
jgi:fructokinase